jgi:membrane protein implicated in regulation of membrane protease activity
VVEASAVWPRDRDGTPVDPVPFLVVAASAVLVVCSGGPPYLLALGLSLPVAVGVSLAVAAVAVGLAYRRYVRRAAPERRAVVPAQRRLGRFGEAIVALAALFALLSLPLLR